MDQKTKIIPRTNSVIGSMKWWPTNSSNSSSTRSTSSAQGFGSSIAVQKLRESKYFKPEESKILCAVVESGFIIETREGQENDGWFGVVQCKTTKGESTPGLYVVCICVCFSDFRKSCTFISYQVLSYKRKSMCKKYINYRFCCIL